MMWNCVSPMEQYEIYPVQSMSLTINNVIFYQQIAAGLSILVTYIGTTRGSQVPTWWGVQNESLYRTILQMVDNFIGKAYTIYFPLLYTIFHQILFGNLIGMIPYTSTPTVEIVMTLSQSFTLQIGVLQQGFLTHKLYLQAAFLPAGTPLALIAPMIVLEIQAYFTKVLSLGLRLAVNMITGHILVKVIVGFIWVGYLGGTSLQVLSLPLFLLTLFQALELLIAYLQAYIFIFITCITIKDMVCTSLKGYSKHNEMFQDQVPRVY